VHKALQVLIAGSALFVLKTNIVNKIYALKIFASRLINNVLRIDESYDSSHPEDLQTKNEASNRKMPMFELTKQILLRYKDYPQNERIFTLSDNGLMKRVAKLHKATPDLPRLTMHELRHTFISRCHEKGIDEIIVQKWVGHAIGSRMTKAVYTHIGNDTEQRYIDLLNAK
jgi:integrase